MDLNTSSTQEVHLSQYWNVIYKRWKIAVAILAVVMAGTFLASYLATPLYRSAVMIQIEDLGFCKKGDGGKFVDAHDLTYKGDFPVNTGGGELSVGQAGLAGGFLHIVEALRQLRGEAEGHQVQNAERALVTGIGWLNYGRNLGTTAALVMERRK